MEILRKLAPVFGLTTAAAGIASLIMPPPTAFALWAAATLVGCIWSLVGDPGLLFGRITVGYTPTLDLIARVIQKGKHETVFVYAAFSVPDELAKHDYIYHTKMMLRRGEFDEYTRVAALRNPGNVSLSEELVREFGKNPRFRFGVCDANSAFPMNMVLVSPCHVVLTFPRDLYSASPQGDMVAIYFRSRRLYSAFTMLRASVWQSATRVADGRTMNDIEIETALRKIQALGNAPTGLGLVFPAEFQRTNDPPVTPDRSD